MRDELRVIIPAAGAGKRLFPHTHTKPKSMVYLAGKPIIGHILERMRDLPTREFIVIVGYKKEQITSYLDKNYSDFNITYVEQEEQLGLGHAVYVAGDIVRDSQVMIALGDMIFKGGYLDFYKYHLNNGKCAGSIGVKEVDEPQKYGIVELNEDKCIKRLEEKPVKSESNLGIAGVYFIRDTPALFNALREIMEKDIRTRGEYQLTDALQMMVSKGHRLKTFPVTSWYDCGRPESLLKTNKVLLDEKQDIDHDYYLEDSVIIQPVAIGDNVTIKNSVVGPYASIANDAYIESSIISESVIGSRSHISKVNLQYSIVGDDASVNGKHNSLNIGDSSSIEF